MVVAVALMALVASACSSPTAKVGGPTSTASTTPSSRSSTPPTVASGPSPGVTATSVTVGQVDDLTAPLPGLFKGAEDGTEAYFDYIDSLGGVNGRMIHLDAQDSAYSDGTVAAATAAQIKSDFALVGGFSLDDAAEEPLVKAAGMPDVAYPLDPGLSNLPDVLQPRAQQRQRLPRHHLQGAEEEVPDPDQARGHPVGQRHPLYGPGREGVRAGRQVRGIQDRLRRRLPSRPRRPSSPTS